MDPLSAPRGYEADDRQHGAIDLPPYAELAALACDLRSRVARMASEMLVIANGLLRAKRLLAHGSFGDWVERELGLDARSAERMLSVARRFEGKTDTVSHLPASVLYELAARSTPDEIVEQVLSGQLEPKVSVIRQARGITPASSRTARQVAGQALASLHDLWQFDDAIETLAEVILAYDNAERAAEELVTLFVEAARIVEATTGGGR